MPMLETEPAPMSVVEAPSRRKPAPAVSSSRAYGPGVVGALVLIAAGFLAGPGGRRSAEAISGAPFTRSLPSVPVNDPVVSAPPLVPMDATAASREPAAPFEDLRSFMPGDRVVDALAPRRSPADPAAVAAQAPELSFTEEAMAPAAENSSAARSPAALAPAAPCKPTKPRRALAPMSFNRYDEAHNAELIVLPVVKPCDGGPSRIGHSDATEYWKGACQTSGYACGRNRHGRMTIELRDGTRLSSLNYDESKPYDLRNTTRVELKDGRSFVCDHGGPGFSMIHYSKYAPPPPPLTCERMQGTAAPAGLPPNLEGFRG